MFNRYIWRGIVKKKNKDDSIFSEVDKILVKYVLERRDKEWYIFILMKE